MNINCVNIELNMNYELIKLCEFNGSDLNSFLLCVSCN